MAINTFGVTASDISGQVQNLSIRSDTSPTTDDVTESILFASAELEQECLAVGIETAGMSDDTVGTYQLLRKAVIYKVTGELLIGRNRGDGESGAYYIERYDKILEVIRKSRQKIEVDSENGPDLAKFLDVGGEAFTSSQFYASIAGRIIYGDSL